MATLPHYLMGCPEAFVRQADVQFVVEGTVLPVHSQFLSRHCAFFATMFEDLDFSKSYRASNPLRLEEPFQGMKLSYMCVFLSSLYNPGLVQSLVNCLSDLNSFTGVYEMADKFNAQLLKAALDFRLANADADDMFKKDLFGWVQLADRFQLSRLRGHCVDLLLHLLVDQAQKAQHQALDWERADKKLVLQLLDGTLQTMHKLQQPPNGIGLYGSYQPPKHLAGRLYYPADSTAQRTSKKGVPWLPEYNYAKGLAQFLFFRRKGMGAAVMKPVVQNVAALMGSTQQMDWYPGAALAPASEAPHPVVVFSHGLAGNRVLYSVLCSELASQGYVVLAVEHADGSASACKTAGGQGWQLYGWDGGLGPQERQITKLRHRVEEMKTAAKVLKALNAGEPPSGLVLSHDTDPLTFLSGALDMNCLAAAGHSFGGCTITALVSECPEFKCGVAMDPWWYPMPADSPALLGWQTRSPLLVMPSHDWAVSGMHSKAVISDPSGEGKSRQDIVLEAARPRKVDGDESSGGGSVFLVVAGSSHNTFADPLALFSERLGWMMGKLGLTARLDPVLGMLLVTAATLNFLSAHLPLSPQQRAVQTWEPSKGSILFQKIKERVDADQPKPGASSSRVRGMLTSVSDFWLNRVLRASRKQEQKEAAAAAGSQADGSVQGAGQSGPEGPGTPRDVVTTEEFLEAAMPSAESASGAHPHAPSQPTDSPGRQQAGSAADRASLGGAAVVAAPVGAAAGLGGRAVVASATVGELRDELAGDGVSEAAVAAAAPALAAVGKEYLGAVQEGEGAQYEALLGSEHIFKCEVHA